MAARVKHRSHILFRKKPPVDWLSHHTSEVLVRIQATSAKFLKVLNQNSNRLFVGYLLLLVKNPRWFESIVSRDG